MGIRRVRAAVGAAVLATAGAAVFVAGGLALAGATPASAAQVWHQSIGRAPTSSACPTLSPDDQAKGWSQWAPSWEQWANDGKGGLTCTRSITWAHDTPTSAPLGGCTNLGEGFVVLDPSGFLAPGTPIYDNETCTAPEVENIGDGFGYAVTSGGLSAATAICQAGNSSQDVSASPIDEYNLYSCDFDGGNPSGNPSGSSGTTYPSAGCVLVAIQWYVDFSGGWSSFNDYVYTDGTCATRSGISTGLLLVYAPTGYNAVDLCLEAFGATDSSYGPPSPKGNDVYGCRG